MKGWSQAEIFTLGLRIAIRKISPSPPQLCLYNNFHGQENPVVKVYNSPYDLVKVIFGQNYTPYSPSTATTSFSPKPVLAST